MNVFTKINNKLKTYKKQKKEDIYNRTRIDRFEFSQDIKKSFPVGDSYWLHVARHIRSIAESDEVNFFRDPEVILHLASENSSLGYRLLDKIRSHPQGSNILNKCTTPPWGAPFLLKNYPFVSPTTASHIANTLSIYDLCGQEISSILDFGGGYGGLARCIATLNPDIKITIFDLPEMHYVQNKFLDATTSFGNYHFSSKVDTLESINFDVFNASFSLSEVPLTDRDIIEKFIMNNFKSVHIIFQDNFNGIDNIEYMCHFKKRLEARGWVIEILKYDWYGWSSAWVLRGHANSPSASRVV